MTVEDQTIAVGRNAGRGAHRGIGIVLFFAFALRVLFAFATPAWQSPDEYPHFWYAQQLSGDFRFPAVTWDVPRYETFQPPFYYALAALIIRSIPGEQPFSFDSVEPPGLLLVSLRMLSVVFGVLTTWVTYLIVMEIPGAGKRAAIVAALFSATLPTFVGTTSSVNNDGLVVLLCALCIRQLLKPGFGVASAAWSGATAGLAFLTKMNAVVLLPLILLRVLLADVPWRTRLTFIVTASAMWMPGGVLAIMKNLSLTGSAFTLPGHVQHEWNLSLPSLFWAIRNLGWSFWLAFGRVYDIAPPSLLYLATVLPLTLAAVVGLWMARRHFRFAIIMTVTGIGLALLASLYYSLSYPSGTMTSWGKNLYCVLPLFAIAYALGWENLFHGKPYASTLGLLCMVSGCAWAAYRLMLLT